MNNPFHLFESITLLAVMFAVELLTIAQAATPNLESVIGPLMQSFGVPGAWLAVIAYTLRKLCLWGFPHAEAIINAHIARQKTMAECQEKLTVSTIAIQEQNRLTLTEIKAHLPRLCQAQFPNHHTQPIQTTSDPS